MATPNHTDPDRSAKPPTANESSERSSAGGGGGSGRRLGWVLLIVSIALACLVIFVGFNQRYWLLTPEEKLISSWKADLQLISNTKQAALLKRVGKVRLRANDHSPAQDWIEKIQAPLEKIKDGDILADVFLIHQIEGHRYGVVVQYEFIDLKTNNKVGEFARTLWLGIYY